MLEWTASTFTSKTKYWLRTLHFYLCLAFRFCNCTKIAIVILISCRVHLHHQPTMLNYHLSPSEIEMTIGVGVFDMPYYEIEIRCKVLHGIKYFWRVWKIESKLELLQPMQFLPYYDSLSIFGPEAILLCLNLALSIDCIVRSSSQAYQNFV